MKKMKKLFAKTITLVLLVAMLIPFTAIPKVEAAEECNGEWEYHTNYYFFMHSEMPSDWLKMFQKKDTTSLSATLPTAYLTKFLYEFPSSGIPMEIEDYGFVEFTRTGNASNSFNAGTETDTWNLKQFYTELSKERKASNLGEDLKQYAFQTSESGTGNTENNRIVTYLFHGDWATSSQHTNISGDDIYDITWDINNTEFHQGDYSESGLNINELVDATIIISGEKKLGALTFANGAAIANETILMNAIKQYNNGKGQYESQTILSGIMSDGSARPIMEVLINRTYKSEDIFDKKLPEKINVNEINSVITLDNSGISYDKTTGEVDLSSFSTLKSITNKNSQGNDVEWFIAPALYQISYKVCKASSNHTQDTVVVTYDGNDKNAKNVPAPSDPIKKGGDYKVSEQEPTLEGNTFKIWRTDPKCESGKKIEPGAKLENLTSDTTLYACWGKTNAEGPKGPLGVLTNAGLFTGIIALAGGTYYIVKKKNLFKKI